jgi:hypothetical protein
MCAGGIQLWFCQRTEPYLPLPQDRHNVIFGAERRPWADHAITDASRTPLLPHPAGISGARHPHKISPPALGQVRQRLAAGVPDP